MFAKRVGNLRSKNFSLKKYFHNCEKRYDKKHENPFLRTARILTSDIVNYFELNNPNEPKFGSNLMFGIPSHTDILIIGGGAIGSSIAYWLKEKSNADSFGVVVVEKDLTFSKSSTALSLGGLRQQFSLPENIRMSLYGAEFLRNLQKTFGPSADVSFTPHGYLMLASDDGAELLMQNHKLQKELGAINVVLSKHQIKDRFPWMNVDDVEIGCLGLEMEGWFDPWSLLNLLKQGAESKKAQYINAEIVDFICEDRKDLYIAGINNNNDINNLKQPRAAVIQTPDGERKTINFSMCIIAAGAESGTVAEMIQIGTGQGILSIPLPVERRKRYVYVCDCETNPPSLNTPMTIDHTGAYFRRDGLGGKFLCGISPPEDAAEPTDIDNLDVNYEFFDKYLWPVLANRVPAFNALKVKTAWSGFYDYNRFDENGIVGPHPYYTNLYIATGFSGHGIQQAPAVGRAVAELILDGNFQTIDLTRLGFDRLLVDKPLLESRII